MSRQIILRCMPGFRHKVGEKGGRMFVCQMDVEVLLFYFFLNYLFSFSYF